MEEMYEGRTQLWMIGSGVEEWDTEQAVCDEIRGKVVQMRSLEPVYKIVEILVSGGPLEVT